MGSMICTYCGSRKHVASSCRWRKALAAALAASVAGAVSVPASAHQDGAMVYDWACCSNMDCAPVIEARVFTPTGSDALPTLVVTSKHGTALVPPNLERRESKDNRMHVCMRPGEAGVMHVICIYQPPGM